MVKKVITKLESSKASGTDCIQVTILKNRDPEISYILVELFNMCLKESCFQIIGMSLRWSLYLIMFQKGLLLKTTALLIFFLWLLKSLKSL